MIKIFLIFCLSTPSFLYAQKIKWSQVEVENKDYKIPKEGEVINTLFDVPETKGLIASSLLVNNDTLSKIQFTKCEMRSDTLKILIHQTDPTLHHEYIITVTKGKYFIVYKFLTSGEQIKRKIEPLEMKLVLNSLDFTKGKEIRGYTEFRGKCVKGCSEDLILVKGNFKVIIE
jgi:hypothetical protein